MVYRLLIYTLEKESVTGLNGEQTECGHLSCINSGNLDLYNEEKGELYHIPFSGLKWLLPVKEKNTKEN